MIDIRLVYLSFFCWIISILSFFNIIYSYYFNYYLNLNTYVITLILSFLLGLFFYFKKDLQKKNTIFQKIVMVLLGYFLFPLLISIPFYFSIYNISFLNSYFEAVSGFTSTGFSIFNNIKYIDESLILWRSSSQWIGGFYFLFSIIYLIDIHDDSLKKSLTNFISFNKSETFKQTIKIFFLYSGLTILIFLILNFSNIRSFNSLNLAFTIISSGGFLPTNNLSSILINNTQIFVFSVLLLLSFFSIFLIYNIIFMKNRNLDFFYEDLHLFFYFIFIITIFLIFFSLSDNYSYILLAITSSISNIGLSIENYDYKEYFFFLILVIIGGSFFSTSSGIRFLKIYSLFKYSINEILSYSRPKNVFVRKFLFTKINFELRDIYKYFLTLIIFVFSHFILTSILSIGGINFEHAFKLSILTLMNTVNSSAYALENFEFNELHFFSKNCLIFFMIIARLELLSLLIICKKFLFKN